jgi:hypothetical protein
MKQIQLLVLSAIVIAFTACKKSTNDDPGPGTTTKPKASVLDQVCQTWILSETYENNVMKTTNGTGKYQFTRQGVFKYEYMGKWEDVGTFDFSSDSSSISMLFMGTSMPTTMKIKNLNEKAFDTEFTYGTTDYLYKYTR